MQFKDMKQGYPVWFLDKENVKAYQGRVVSVAVPRYDAPVFGQMNAQTGGMVVDVTIDAEGGTKTYTIPEGSCVAYAGKLVIAAEKGDIVREVESVKAASEDALGKVEKHREALGKCEAILEELNPELAEKKEQDRRIEGIESEVKSLGEMVREFINEFRK